MNKQQVIKTLKKHSLSESEEIEIFNWYIKNKSPEIYADFVFPHPLQGHSYKLKEQEISTTNSTNSTKLLKYSINKIKEYLNIK